MKQHMCFKLFGLLLFALTTVSYGQLTTLVLGEFNVNIIPFANITYINGPLLNMTINGTDVSILCNGTQIFFNSSGLEIEGVFTTFNTTDLKVTSNGTQFFFNGTVLVFNSTYIYFNGTDVGGPTAKVASSSRPNETGDEEDISDDDNEDALGTEVTNGGADGTIPNDEWVSPASKRMAAQVAGKVKVNPGVRVGPVGKLLVRIIEHYPKRGEIYITSALRNEPGSHHGGKTYRGSPTAAIDIGANGKDAARRRRDMAKWLYDNFIGATVQLIHTTPFANDKGFYVFAQRKNAGAYNQKTKADHRDHVHFATSKALAEEILTKLKK
jgi:hypothetical protein